MACEEAKRQWLEAEAEMLKVWGELMAKPKATEAELEEFRKVNERYSAAFNVAAKAVGVHLTLKQFLTE